eukprot:3214049-Amphidinium_carterae.1
MLNDTRPEEPEDFTSADSSQLISERKHAQLHLPILGGKVIKHAISFRCPVRLANRLALRSHQHRRANGALN